MNAEKPKKRAPRVFRVMVVILGLIIIVLLGELITHFVISDGTKGFSGERRTAAKDALQWADAGCVEAPETLVVRRLQVARIDLEPGLTKSFQGDEIRAYRATIRKITFYGIPIGDIVVIPDKKIVYCTGAR